MVLLVKQTHIHPKDKRLHFDFFNLKTIVTSFRLEWVLVMLGFSPGGSLFIDLDVCDGYIF